MTRLNRGLLRGFALALLAFPGAAAAQACAIDSDCSAGEMCMGGLCLAPSDTPCNIDGDCPELGSVCMSNVCWSPGAAGGGDGGAGGSSDAGDGGGAGGSTDAGDGGGAGGDTDAGDAGGGGSTGGDLDVGTGGSGGDPGSGGSDLDGGVEDRDAGGTSGGSCTDDSDCGAGELCLACACIPAEGICLADTDCAAGQRCDLFSVASAGAPGEDAADAGQICEATYGYCAIDVANIPTNPACQPFCDSVATCQSGASSSGSAGSSSGSAGTGTGTASRGLGDDDLANCLGYCSYLLGDASTAAQMQALITCVADNADAACDALGSACQSAANALGDVAGDVPAGISGGADNGGSAGGAGAPEAQSAGDLFRGAFGGGGATAGGGGGADAGLGSDVDGGNGADTGGGSSGGCAIGGRPNSGALAAVLLALTGLGVSRRRRR